MKGKPQRLGFARHVPYFAERQSLRGGHFTHHSLCFLLNQTRATYLIWGGRIINFKRFPLEDGGLEYNSVGEDLNSLRLQSETPVFLSVCVFMEKARQKFCWIL